MIRLSILGSTGSIGCTAMALVKSGLPDVEITALAAGANARLLEEQARLFRPRKVALFDEDAARDLRVNLADTQTVVLGGIDGVLEAAAEPSDICLNAIVGIAGLRPTMSVIQNRAAKRIALANKETIVCAGNSVLSAAKNAGIEVIPVDSEHSAIFQCLAGQDKRAVKKLWLTASGGPFFGYSASRLKNVTIDDALRHPNWAMGRKITVDSATLMNKGLEFIEAMRLFNVNPQQIGVIVHRESIVHSMVEFVDGALLAQLGIPDMTIPIQYALTYPTRLDGGVPPPDLFSYGSLSFLAPDLDTFKCLTLAMDAAGRGESACAALNAANEAAVAAFLDGRLKFADIPNLVELAAQGFEGDAPLPRIFEIDLTVREKAAELVANWR